MRAVFVHGSGRHGATAWPGLSDEEFVFVTRGGFEGEPERTDFAADARRVHDAVGDGAHVVAASYGGIAALQAAASGTVRSLVLVEPAAFSLSRGLPATEAHVAAVDPVMRTWETTDAPTFAIALLTALGVPDAVAPPFPLAEVWRLQRAPWHAELDAGVIARVPTLVITGNWNPEYEELAGRLVELGATHTHLEGHGHAAHEHPEFENTARTFWKMSASV